MIICQQCGNSNTDNSQYCRFCGDRLSSMRPSETSYRPPRPYAWKTDEFQTQAEARPNRPPVEGTPHTRPLSDHRVESYVPMQGRYGLGIAVNYRCMYCGTNMLPITERRISSAGWIVFALLLVFTFVFFWIGLLLKENVQICPVCRNRVG